MKKLIGMLAVTGLVLSGCVTDETDSVPEDEEEVGEASQEITDWMYTWHSANFDDGFELDLGSSADKTCFLAGVKGSLKGWSSWSSSSYTVARAEVVNTGGHWKVRTGFGNGAGVAAKVACISETANRVSFGATFSGNNDISTSFAAVTPKRRCFITGIRGRGHGWTSFVNEQPNPPPGVSIFSDGINFRFTGNVVDHSDGTWSAYATAVCVDVDDGADQVWTLNGPQTKTLSSGDFACGFERISGVFTDPVSVTGLELFHSGSPTWQGTAADDYIGRVRCVH